MFALDLLRRQFSYRVLRGRKMPPIGTRLVCVIPGDAKGGEQGAELEEYCILTRAKDIHEYSSRVMIKRMPDHRSVVLTPTKLHISSSSAARLGWTWTVSARERGGWSNVGGYGVQRG